MFQVSDKCEEVTKNQNSLINNLNTDVKSLKLPLNNINENLLNRNSALLSKTDNFEKEISMSEPASSFLPASSKSNMSIKNPSMARVILNLKLSCGELVQTDQLIIHLQANCEETQHIKKSE